MHCAITSTGELPGTNWMVPIFYRYSLLKDFILFQVGGKTRGTKKDSERGGIPFPKPDG